MITQWKRLWTPPNIKTRSHADWETQSTRNGSRAETIWSPNRKRLHSRPSANGSKSRRGSYPTAKNPSSSSESRHPDKPNPGSQAVEITHTGRHRIDIHRLKGKEVNTTHIRPASRAEHSPPREPTHTAHGVEKKNSKTTTPSRTVSGSERLIPQINGSHSSKTEYAFYV